MRQKIIVTILSVSLILLVFVLCEMGLKIYELQGRISELNTRVAFLESKAAPHYEFIEKFGENGPTEENSPRHTIIIEASPDTAR
jgi:hypothetical protein